VIEPENPRMVLLRGANIESWTMRMLTHRRFATITSGQMASVPKDRWAVLLG
jgi:hypothetical protein